MDHVSRTPLDVFKNEARSAARRLSHQPLSTGLKNILTGGADNTLSCTANSRLRTVKWMRSLPIFSRRMMSVVVEWTRRGAPALDQGRAGSGVQKVHTFLRATAKYSPWSRFLVGTDRALIRSEHRRASGCCGRRQQEVGRQRPYQGRRGDLVLTGYVAFLDPPKDTAANGDHCVAGDDRKGVDGDNDLSRARCAPRWGSTLRDLFRQRCRAD